MQLGKALVGAIIGAVLGIVFLIVIYLSPLQLDAVWLAIPVALLTGLGVRMLVKTGGHASYLRGAMTGILALAAYLAGWFIVAGLAQQRASAAAQASPNLPAVEAPASDDAAEEATKEGKEEAAAAPAQPAAEAVATRPRAADAIANQRAAMPKTWSTLDFIWLCAAGLIAYELGRGSGNKTVATSENDAPTVPQGVHPDA